MYEIRDRMEMNIKGTADHLGNIADGKVQMIEEALKTMHTLVAANTERETSISKYLEELQGTRPQEGQAIIDSFRRVEQELGSVKERIQAYEHKVATGPAQLFPTSPPARR